jgi:predicted O-methyltransferase YrrM
MDEALSRLLVELEQYGQKNDRAVAGYSQRMLNITRDTGEFYAVILRAMGAKQILEIGTSNGFSTLWLATAAYANGGQVTTVEMSDFKIGLAQKNFQRSGLASIITQLHANADQILAKLAPDSFDFIFLDSQRESYAAWWPEVKRILRPGGLVGVDNAISHAEEMRSFVALVKGDPTFTTSLVPVGNGEFLAVKER